MSYQIFKKIRFSFFFVFVLMSIGCNHSIKRSSENDINISHYKDNRVDVYAYHPSLLKRLEAQIENDNQFVRNRRSQMTRIEHEVIETIF